MGINWNAIEWGTVGEWVGGIGALTAAVVALAIALTSILRARSADARQVVFAVEHRRRDGTPVKPHVRMLNRSPVRMPRILLLGSSVNGSDGRTSVSPDDLDPGGSDFFEAPDGWDYWVHFVDPSGVEWARSSKGKLRKSPLKRNKPPGR